MHYPWARDETYEVRHNNAKQKIWKTLLRSDEKGKHLARKNHLFYAQHLTKQLRKIKLSSKFKNFKFLISVPSS